MRIWIKKVGTSRENIRVAGKKWGKERRPKCLKKRGRFRKMYFGVEEGGKIGKWDKT